MLGSVWRFGGCSGRSLGTQGHTLLKEALTVACHSCTCLYTHEHGAKIKAAKQKNNWFITFWIKYRCPKQVEAVGRLVSSHEFETPRSERSENSTLFNLFNFPLHNVEPNMAQQGRQNHVEPLPSFKGTSFSALPAIRSCRG